MNLLGPRVTQDTVDALHWHSVKYITNVKNRTTTVKYSNEHYPIFIRECIIKEATGDNPEEKFYKVYEPLNYDKGFRFSYTPAGKKPRYYINGLFELKEAYRVYNANEEREWLKTNDDDKPYKEKSSNMLLSVLASVMPCAADLLVFILYGSTAKLTSYPRKNIRK